MANINITKISESRARAWQDAVTQVIPSAVLIPIILNSERYDTLGEFNSVVVSGTAEENGGVNLKDTGVFTEVAGYYTIMWAWNTTDNTYTTVTGKTSDDILTLASNIFTVGETFKLYSSRFTPTVAGYYLIIGQVFYATVTADNSYNARIHVNGSEVAVNAALPSATDAAAPVVSDIYYLNVGDYVQLYTYQGSGVTRNIQSGGSSYTYLSVHRLN